MERTGTPVFSHSFDYAFDAAATRSIHGMEINLLFGNDFGASQSRARRGDRDLSRRPDTDAIAARGDRTR